jgi:spermidine synthase/tetratricopeptide (TPR) repeat protein
MALATSMCLAVGAIGLWLRLPADHAITRAMPRPLPGEQLLAIKEGVAELVAVKEGPGAERQLLTNGHAMSATGRLAQRYMRALAHLPLLSMDRPARVLVIGFGVGNTAHAAVLHPSVERVDVADLSSDVLSYAGYFGDTNGGVLSDPRTVVYVNDGRQHLRMQPPASYDLITLEPPPLTLSGVGALYAREFYELARTRLEPGGYLSQWLPFYQVPPSTLFSMIRAFVDVFPQAVLLGGTDEDLLLVGTTAPRIEVDPARLAAALARAPLVEADLRRLGLGSVLEIAGTFVASARTLDEATRRSRPTTDDRPIQEYVTGSRLTAVRVAGVPSTIVQVGQVGAWCPGCVAGTPVPFIEELNAYLALLDPVYRRATLPAGRSGAAIDVQRLAGEHEYLREVLADWAARQNVRGATLAAEGRIDEAIIEFQSALRFTPNSAETHWNLGRALMDRGITEAALDHLRRSVILDPGHGPARYDLGSALLDLQRPDEALTELRAAVRLMPASAEAWNHLGIALGSQGKLDEAIAVFERALALRPALPTAQQNLAMAQQALSARGAARRRSGPR